ncbi:MAG: dihydroneopterin aldolase [Candidatus Eremiobacteraeota bacterium]|nr:dihydroneopterin aldolase [Candidatus Eremiobacteraeota bacterium]
MDRIALRGIVARGRHGANPGERDTDQPFEIDVEFDVDLAPAQRSDRLEDTPDYGAIYERIVAIVATTSYRLLEALAGKMLDDVFADRRIARATLTIGKPKLLGGATPSITLVRDNPKRLARF